MIRGVIDRIEDGVAVILLEEGGRAYVPRDRLPPGAGPGSLLKLTWEIEGQADPGEVAALIEHLRQGHHLK